MFTKKFFRVLCLSLSLLMLLAIPAGAGETVDINIYLAGATPAGGGVWDMIGAGLAEAILRGNPGAAVTVVPGGGVSDVPEVSVNNAELGLTHSVLAIAGVAGTDPFPQAYTNIKGIAGLYPSQLQFIINPGVGVTSIAEIIEKKLPIRIAVGDPGSTGELATKRMFEGYGITYEDIESWGGTVTLKDMGEAATMYGDDIIDAFTLLTLAPAGPLQQVASSKAVQMLAIDETVIQFMVDTYGYTPAVVPGTAYDFIEGDLPSVSAEVVVITNDAFSEQAAYQVTKALIENLDYIKSIHVNLSELTLDDLVKTSIELHPGARRAYEEAGVTIPQ